MEVLVAFLVSLLVAMGICACAVAAVVHALVVRNRVVPSRRSPASLSWLVSPGAAARLHRRLRTAMAGAHTAVANPWAVGLGLVELVSELRERALELDAQLVLAARSPQPTRSRMMRELQGEVLEVEQLAGRVIYLSRMPGGPNTPAGLSAVRERLELLESALHELDGVEMRPPPAALPWRGQV